MLVLRKPVTKPAVVGYVWAGVVMQPDAKVATLRFVSVDENGDLAGGEITHTISGDEYDAMNKEMGECAKNIMGSCAKMSGAFE